MCCCHDELHLGGVHGLVLLVGNVRRMEPLLLVALRMLVLECREEEGEKSWPVLVLHQRERCPDRLVWKRPG